MPVPILKPNLNTAVPNPSRIPGVSPGGRGVNPATGIIGSMPGGMDYLAGLGPAPAGVNLPDMAPIIHLANLAGMQRPNETLQQKIARWSASQSPFQQLAAQRAAITQPATPVNPAPTPATPLAPVATPPPAQLPSGRMIQQTPPVPQNRGWAPLLNFRTR